MYFVFVRRNGHRIFLSIFYLTNISFRVESVDFLFIHPRPEQLYCVSPAGLKIGSAFGLYLCVVLILFHSVEKTIPTQLVDGRWAIQI